MLPEQTHSKAAPVDRRAGRDEALDRRSARVPATSARKRLISVRRPARQSAGAEHKAESAARERWGLLSRTLEVKRCHNG